MKRCSLPSLVLALLGVVGAAAAACNTNGTAPTLASAPPPPDGGDDGDVSSPDAGDGGSDGGPPRAYLRVAQLSASVGAIDVCVAPHGTTSFSGPLVATLVSDDAGLEAGSPGVTYPQVSAYVALDPGQLDVRLVAAGASCASPLRLSRMVEVSDGGDEAGLIDASSGDAEAFDAAVDATVAADAASVPSSAPDWTNLPPLPVSTYATLLVAGDVTAGTGGQGLSVTMIEDDPALPGGAAVLRAVNAVPGVPSLDFGVGSFATGWMPLLVNVTFGAASTAAAPNEGQVDARGYLPIDPASVQTLSARASSGGTTDVATASQVTITRGSVVTAFAIGGATTSPASLLLCADNQPSGGLLSDCSVAQ